MKREKEFEGKKLLILGAIDLCCDIVKCAQKMGAYVIVADYNEDAPAKKIADESVLIDALDVDALTEFCRKNKVDGVTTGFVDILMPPCYELCKRLNLPYYVTPKMLSMSTNKIDFKETCKQYGVPVPQTFFIGSELTEQTFRTIQYPVFVKPLDASGSRGAGVCYNTNEIQLQFAEAVSCSPSGKAIIEEYVTGKEFLLDYIAVNGEFRLLEMFDRYACSDRRSAINFANVSIAPSQKIDNYLENVNQKVITMFQSLGFTDGLIFLQGHSNGDKITFYEMGCRLGGAFYNIEQACLGYNTIEMIVRYALSGKMINNINEIKEDVAKYSKLGVSLNYLLKSNGDTIAEISGVDYLKADSSVVAVIQSKFVGDQVVNDNTMDKPLVTIHFVVESMQQLKNKLADFNDNVDALNSNGSSMLMNKIQPSDIL